jgi:hypothetical protein
LDLRGALGLDGGGRDVMGVSLTRDGRSI